MTREEKESFLNKAKRYSKFIVNKHNKKYVYYKYYSNTYRESILCQIDKKEITNITSINIQDCLKNGNPVKIITNNKEYEVFFNMNIPYNDREKIGYYVFFIKSENILASDIISDESVDLCCYDENTTIRNKEYRQKKVPHLSQI